MQNQTIIVSQTESNVPCEILFASNEKKEETPFANVVGHANQKKELLNVLDWFKRSHELRAKGVSVPKGIILFGDPGNGKSLFMKEIIKYANVPSFVYQGEENNIVEGVIELFKKAKDIGKAIVVIDELDLLIDKDRRVSRALQENLDGVESSDDILVLAATNDIDEIPDALLRSGRLDKRIEIENPNRVECLSMFKKTLDEFGLVFPNSADEEEVGILLYGCNFADIKAIVNDIVLRNGFGPITPEMIDQSILTISGKVIDANPETDYLEIAIHEAGHAVMARAYPNFFTIDKLSIRAASGEFQSLQVEEGFWPYDKVVADIRVSMAGILAQKIIYGRGSRGCEGDLQRARAAAYNLFNAAGYSSCWETLPIIKSNARADTPVKRRRMERKIERFLKKQEKATVRYLKRHKGEIERLGELLYQKKRLKPSEILSCFAFDE